MMCACARRPMGKCLRTLRHQHPSSVDGQPQSSLKLQYIYDEVDADGVVIISKSAA